MWIIDILRWLFPRRSNEYRKRRENLKSAMPSIQGILESVQRAVMARLCFCDELSKATRATRAAVEIMRIRRTRILQEMDRIAQEDKRRAITRLVWLMTAQDRVQELYGNLVEAAREVKRGKDRDQMNSIAKMLRVELNNASNL